MSATLTPTQRRAAKAAKKRAGYDERKARRAQREEAQRLGGEVLRLRVVVGPAVPPAVAWFREREWRS